LQLYAEKDRNGVQVIKKEQERRSGAFRLETNPVVAILMTQQPLSYSLFRLLDINFFGKAVFGPRLMRPGATAPPSPVTPLVVNLIWHIVQPKEKNTRKITENKNRYT